MPKGMMQGIFSTSMEPKTYVDASEHGVYHQIIWKICVYIYIYDGKPIQINGFRATLFLDNPPCKHISHMWIHRYPNLDPLQLIQAS